VESQPGYGSIFTFTLPIFSLSKLLSPLLTEQGRLRDSFIVLQVDLLPLSSMPAGQDWKSIRRLALEILERCIYYVDKDLVLPPMISAARVEGFLSSPAPI
jgi:hypothetical protein